MKSLHLTHFMKVYMTIYVDQLINHDREAISVSDHLSDSDEWENNHFLIWVPKGHSAEGVRNTVANTEMRRLWNSQ